jgi:hypothetical protein
MNKRALRRAIGLCTVLITVSLLLSGVPVGSTFAFFDGQTQNSGSVLAAGWIGAPTGAIATASGYDVGFTWTAGTHGPVTGQQLWGVDHTTTNNCTGVTYASLATLASATTTAYTDSNRGSTANGDWYCYQLVSTSASSWTASLALPALQLGLVATTLAITNVATAGSIANTDKIAITFNQPTTLAAVTGTLRVCVWAGASGAGSIVIGDNTGACTAATDTSSIGKITNITVATTRTFATSSSTVAGSTVTITLAGGAGTSVESGAAKFTPSATGANPVKSSATTDQATACAAATTNCQPSTSSTF